MGKNYIHPDLDNRDELLHQPTNELKWRESYYFNWADLENKISGFSTIGIVPNEKKKEFVFLLFLEDRNEVYYKEPYLQDYSDDISIMLRENKLSYTLVKPFEEWIINYKSRKLGFELHFKTRFPTHNFGMDSSKSWHQHFESSGIITGKLTKKNGEIVNLNGFGQRDKSWGFRDWHEFDKWYAGHFQFKNWSCAFRKDYSYKNIDLSGHISNIQRNTALSKLDIDTLYDTDPYRSPLSTTYIFEDATGAKHTIEAKRFGKNSFIRFARNFSGGYTELFEQMAIVQDLDTGEIGVGMMEHLRTIKSDKK
ncbi:MAG: DUF7065 domain-containing protein [Promethearchaeota archaeon]